MFRIYLKQCSVDYISNLENDFIAGWQWDYIYIFAIYKNISWQGDSVTECPVDYISNLENDFIAGWQWDWVPRWLYISNLENDFIAGLQWNWVPRWLYIEFRKRFHGGGIEWRKHRWFVAYRCLPLNSKLTSSSVSSCHASQVIGRCSVRRRRMGEAVELR